MAENKTYDQEYKVQAVKLAKEIGQAGNVARRLKGKGRSDIIREKTPVSKFLGKSSESPVHKR